MFRRALFLALLLATPAAAQERAWPSMVSATRFVSVADAGADPALEMTIFSPAGAALYELECHAPSYEDHLNSLAYSGLFQCYLYPHGEASDYLLLSIADHDGLSSDWTNRGRFLARQLEQPCAAYRDWGATRRFRLRGMMLTLSVTDIRYAEGHPAAYRLTARAVPDSNAHTSHAAPVTTPEPLWFSRSDSCS